MKKEKSYFGSNMKKAKHVIKVAAEVQNVIDNKGQKLLDEFGEFNSIMGVVGKDERATFMLGYSLSTGADVIVNSMKTMKTLEDMHIPITNPRMQEVYQAYKKLDAIMPNPSEQKEFVEYYHNVIRAVNATRKGRQGIENA